MAADTLETLHALGVKNVISVGMIGAFVKQMQIGDIVIPDRAYVEEGTSLHYYESLAYSQPDPVLFENSSSRCQLHILPRSYLLMQSIDRPFIRKRSGEHRMCWGGYGNIGTTERWSILQDACRFSVDGFR